jgi:hypothetical protein
MELRGSRDGLKPDEVTDSREAVLAAVRKG